MSVFSDLLSEYITMKDVGVYPLSQFCGLDRSFMYKIINGNEIRPERMLCGRWRSSCS